MDNFFDVLNAALDEAIADAKNPYLERDVVTKEEQPRAKQIDNLLKGLDFYFSRSVNRVQNIILENGCEYRKYNHEDKNQIFIALQLMQTVKAIIDTSMFFEDGSFKGNNDSNLETGEKVLKLLNSI